MTVRTRTQLKAEAAAALPDNTSGEIAPSDVRGRVEDLADSAFLPEDAASDADIRAAEENKVLTSANIWEAAEAVDLGNLTGTVALDFADFLGLAYGTATGNITLGATSNVKPGQTIVLDVKQDATGGRTLAVNTTYWLTPGGTALAWDTAANARNVLVGTALGDGKVLLALAGKKVS